jgi:nitroimidazol reductase NimA-like FMN-containing flavoprotein (pyridoxamine 5'-phosphate oxidase superfamily)
MADTPPSRPTHRGHVEALDEATCRRLLTEARIARVVHVVDDVPQISVVNIGMDGDDVVVRSSRGSRLATALATPGAPVLVEADALDPESRSGWSVVARGHMTPVLDQVVVARLDRTVPPSWILGDVGGTWLRLTVEELSGRAVGGAIG